MGRVRQTDHEDQAVGDQAEAVGQEAEDNQTEGEDQEEEGDEREVVSTETLRAELQRAAREADAADVSLSTLILTSMRTDR